MIRKLLVANRGEIALRVMRSAHEAGIACVALWSDPDASAPHVAAADESVRLAGLLTRRHVPARRSRRRGGARAERDAVHPGYGFLVRERLVRQSLRRCRPHVRRATPDVIEAMGSKLTAKATMASAGVPVLPTVEIGPGTGGDLAERVEAIGFPLLVKASAGGGGRGMRVVEDAGSLASAVESARREARRRSATGPCSSSLTPSRPRHIEVQVVGDSHGNVVHLFERECSIQRRHQKIVEESPSPVPRDWARAESATRR